MVAASRRLRVSQPAISAQVRALEHALGEKLFSRVGRGLALTEVGKVTFCYADEIFLLGRGLRAQLSAAAQPLPTRLAVGLVQSLPKLVAFRILEPALHLGQLVRLDCREDRADHLLAELSLHGLDLVLADQPLASTGNIRAFNHLLGESELAVFAVPTLAQQLRANFPASLDGAPFLLPRPHTGLRQNLDLWFEQCQVKPKVVGEFDDSAFLKVFAEHGAGAFVGACAVEGEIAAKYGVELVARLPTVRERYYAITVERLVRQPAVVAILTAARRTLFA